MCGCLIQLNNIFSSFGLWSEADNIAKILYSGLWILNTLKTKLDYSIVTLNSVPHMTKQVICLISCIFIKNSMPNKRKYNQITYQIKRFSKPNSPFKSKTSGHTSPTNNSLCGRQRFHQETCLDPYLYTFNLCFLRENYDSQNSVPSYLFIES